MMSLSVITVKVFETDSFFCHEWMSIFKNYKITNVFCLFNFIKKERMFVLEQPKELDIIVALDVT